MSATQPIIDALRDHVQQAIPWVQVDEFPERPEDYQFIHHHRRGAGGVSEQPVHAD